MKEQSMNYCCDCGWAIRKGFIFKTWYCTCPELNWPYPVRDSVTGEPALNFGEMIPSKVILMPGSIPLMPSFKTCEMVRLYEHEGPCPYFKLKGFAPPRKHPLPCPPLPERTPVHPFVPPKTTPYHEAPPMPKMVAKAMEEHDAAYLMNQKQKELEAENKLLKEAKRELLLILKKTCTLYNINAQCQEYVDECKNGLEQSCSVFRTIQKYDRKDCEK